MSELPLRARLPLAALSIAASVLLFSHVQLQNAPRAEPMPLRVRFEVRNVPPGMVVTSAPTEVPMRVTGPVQQLDSLDREKIVAYLDLTNATPGDKRMPFELERPNLRNVEFLPVRNTVEVRLERVVQRQVRVTVEPGGLPRSPQLSYRSAVVEPEAVTLDGPESLVNGVQDVRVRLDLSRVEPANPTMNLVLPVEVRRNGRPVINPMLSVDPTSVTVRALFTELPPEKTLLVVPSLRGQPAFGYRVVDYSVEPSTVSVQGPSNRLGELRTAVTQAVSVQGLTQSQSFRVQVVTPRGLRVQGTPFVTVRVEVERDPAANAAPPPPATGGQEPPNP